MKLIVSIAAVIVLSLLAERASPRWAGLVSGYPTGSAITLFFFGLEQSPDFAAQSAVFNLTGLIAMQIFVYCYFRISETNFRFPAAMSSLASVCTYFPAICILRLVPENRLISLLLTVFSIFIFIRLFRNVKDSIITSRVKLSFSILLIRAIAAASIILLVTGMAQAVGPEWAGLFSAFPTTLFPLILIVHKTYGVEHVQTILKNVPAGLGSLVLYSLTVSFAYPAIGIYWGTIAAFAAATVYLILFAKFLQFVK
ncbi:MAG: hypothetical protein PHW04_11130 [Candidatus Wallbacteria bacterium]|nr:hypothetical protein [Candidatus Wallbacteria bacterium]